MLRLVGGMDRAARTFDGGRNRLEIFVDHLASVWRKNGVDVPRTHPQSIPHLPWLRLWCSLWDRAEPDWWVDHAHPFGLPMCHGWLT